MRLLKVLSGTLISPAGNSIHYWGWVEHLLRVKLPCWAQNDLSWQGKVQQLVVLSQGACTVAMLGALLELISKSNIISDFQKAHSHVFLRFFQNSCSQLSLVQASVAQNLGGKDVIEHLNTMAHGTGHSFSMSWLKDWRCTFAEAEKEQRLGRQASGFLLSVCVPVSSVLSICIQPWVFVGPAGWAFSFLKGDLFLQT